MKSRSNRSGGLGRRLFQIVLVLGLLAIGFAADESPWNVNGQSWLQIAAGKWPPTAEKGPYYVYHSEYNEGGPLFGLNQKLFDGVDLAEKTVDLSFQYWINKGTIGSFRARPNPKQNPTKDVKLIQTADAFQAADLKQLKDITLEEWKSFAFIDIDPATVALKDVQVKYLENVQMDHAKEDFTAYKANSQSQRFNAVSASESLKKDTKSIVFAGKSATIDVSALAKKSVKLDLTVGGKTESVTVGDTVAASDAIKKLIEIKSELISKEDTNLKSFTITLKDETDLGFTITKIDDKPIEDLSKIQISSNDNLYAAVATTADNKNQQAYITFKDAPSAENKDICYKVQSNKAAKVDVYITFENAKIGTKLTTLTAKSGDVCVFSNYIPLKNVGNFMITLAVNGDPAGLVLTWSKTEPAYALVVNQPNGALVKSNQWYYFNPGYDYELDGSEVTGGDQEIFACDVAANCVPYQKVDAKKYVLKKASVASVLAKSPYVRIQYSSVDKAEKLKFSASNEKTLNTNLDNKFKELNPGNKNANGIQKLDTFDGQKRATVNIPLDVVDFRVNQIKFTIKLKKTSDNTEIASDQLFLVNANSQANEFKIPINGGLLSTKDLFLVQQAENAPLAGKSLSLVLQLGDNTEPKDKYVEVGYSLDKSVKVTPVPNFKIPASKPTVSPAKSQNNPAKPLEYLVAKKQVVIISSDWIQSTAEKEFYKTELDTKIDFTPKDHAIKADDISVIRIILGQEKQLVKTLIPLANGNTSLELKDDTKTDADTASFQLQGPFRVGYVLISNADFDITATLVNFTVNSIESNPATCGKAILADINCKYDKQIVAPTFNTNGEVTNVFRLVTQSCDADETKGCENIFSQKLLSAQNVPGPVVNQVLYVPNQLNGKDPLGTHYLNVTRPDGHEKDDFCVEFSYLSKEVKLLVSASQEYTLNQIAYAPGKEAKQETICASQLANDVSNVKSIFFSFEAAQIVTVGNHYVKLEKQTFKTFVEPIKEGISALTPNLEQFVKPDKKWSLEKQTIKFAIDLEALRKLTPPINVTTSLLQTKWIKVPKAKKLRVAFKADGSGLNDNAQKIQVIFSTPNAPAVVKSIKELDSGKINVFDTLVAKEDYVQIALKVNIDTNGIDTFTNESKIFSFSLSDFTVNNPCLVSLKEEIKCGQNPSDPKLNKGTCKPYYEEFTANCTCTQGNSGTNCQTTDYCNTTISSTTYEKLYCEKNKKKCRNVPERDAFECVCDEKAELWEPISMQCLKLEALKCKANEVYSANAGKCICMDDFVKVNETCVAYDLCNPNHRKIKLVKNRRDQPCAANAECKALGWEDDDYICQCKDGFYNVDGINDPLTATCRPKICQECEQHCLKKTDTEYVCKCNDGYTLSGTKCTPNANVDVTKCKYNATTGPASFLADGNKMCKCPDGFAYKEDDVNGCVIIPSLFTNLCKDGGKVIWRSEDKLPGCQCAEGQKFDTTKRKCVQECSDDFAKKCSDKGASCQFSNSKATCECPAGEIAFTTSEATLEDWKCVSICDKLLLEPSNYNFRCSKDFQHCDPKSSEITLKQPDKFKPSTLIEKIYANQTTLTSGKYCKCDLRFKPVDEKKKPDDPISYSEECQPSSLPTHTISGMQFSIDAARSKDKSYIEGIKMAFEELIKDIFSNGDQRPVVHNTLCEPSGSVVKCSTSFESDKSDKVIKAKLKAACVSIDETRCVYVTKKAQQAIGRRRKRQTQTTSATSYQLVSEKKIDPDSTTNEFCSADKDPCEKKPYTKCVPQTEDNNKPFACKCEKKDFIKVESSETKTLGKSEITMEICSINNLCHDASKSEAWGCKDSQNTTCHFEVEKVANEYVANTYCKCDKTGLTLASRNYSCKQTCWGTCKNSEFCSIDDRKPNEEPTCHCLEGFSGKLCTEKSEAAKESKGYMIATIVVSIIAALAIIGLAVLWFRRR